MDEGRKRVVAIIAGILVARHFKTPEDLFGTPSGSPRGTNSVAHKRAFRRRRCFELQHREISDGGDYLPECALRIHRNHRRSLWPPFHPCSAPSGPVLGLVAAFRGGHLQLDHGWNCGQ